ncbi:MAG: pyridoxal phosphate-dependent aminotransferase [bacterium]|nr:pyridoxal phosphate-dependent aminotransferase [bacterium]
MQTAARLQGMRPSPVRMLSEGAPPDAVPLGLGEPTWTMPEAARIALTKFQGVCGYGHNMGIPELRETVAKYYNVSIDQIMMTGGSQGALFAMLQAYIGPGDKVLVPDPGFVAYPGITRMAGGEVVRYSLSPKNRFRLTAEAVLPHLDIPGLKAVVINFPSNPTGAGTTVADLKAIADACRQRDLLLISDEVYRDLYFGERPPSLREVTDYGIVVSSVSKAWGSPGLRVGWAVGDPAVMAAMRIMHSFMVTGVSVPAQRAAIALIENSAEIHAAARREVQGRWEALHAALKEFMGVDAPPPDGAFYYWTQLPVQGTGDPLAFCFKLRDEGGVVTVPGGLFGDMGKPYLRISFAAFPEQLREGIKRLARFW